MRTETLTITNTYYTYDELSDSAKERAKEDYLSGNDPQWFKEDVENSLSALFPNSNLDVQFSLSSCQGDGLNIYGELTIKDAIEYVKDELSAKEIRFLEWVEKVWNYDISLPENHRYCFSIKNQVYIFSTISLDLEYDGYRGIKYEILEHFEELLQDKLSALDNEYEKAGYEYFYEISDDDMSAFCNDMGWEFFEDGSLAA